MKYANGASARAKTPPRLNGPFQMLCASHWQPHFPLTNVPLHRSSSLFSSVFPYLHLSPVHPAPSFSTFTFPPQPASQIRDIRPGVRAATHKILTACREFCVATFLFIFNSVSTSRGTVICVCSSVLIPGLYKAMFTSYLSTYSLWGFHNEQILSCIYICKIKTTTTA